MDNNRSRLVTYAVLVGALSLAAVVLAGGAAVAAGDGQVIVELRQNNPGELTYSSVFSYQEIGNTNSGTRQEYKFQRQREGRDFSYVVANLSPSTGYSVELSFVEHEFSSPQKRVFNVYLQGSRVMSKLDVYSRAGANSAYQKTFSATSDPDGLVDIGFRSDESGCTDFATVSTIRVYRGSDNLVEIDPTQNRNDMDAPPRFENQGNQDCFETVLGRMGSRLYLDLASQRLGARFTSLGDGTGDLADLILALEQDGKVRCLPFTDRYPVWESISQTQTMTERAYSCSSENMPFDVDVTFRSPFYPQEGKLSRAPFFYVDVKVENASTGVASGNFIYAWPLRQSFGQSSISENADATEAWIEYDTRYHYSDETYNSYQSRKATECLALPAGEAADVAFKGAAQADFEDFTADSLWGYDSPSGYPVSSGDYRAPLYSYYPRGYCGAEWTITDLAPGASVTRHFLMAGYVSQKVLEVENSSYSDDSFRFKYTQELGDIQQVLEYAIAGRADILDKSDFFDGTISSGDYLQLPAGCSGAVTNLVEYSFQSFIMNTWWAHSDEGREWFSVWEGSCCRYHSTVDVAYNHAWFYLYYWPELLQTVMDEWVLYLQESKAGTFLSHDMGYQNEATGQAYPHNMEVEENANFILILYKYWKTTGDTAYMRGKYKYVKDFVDFIIACDENNNGIPDKCTDNTIDQGSYGIQSSADQCYLGVKCLAAHQAAREMALSQSTPDIAYEARCRAEVEDINQTLAYDMWLSDHFAVCLDGDADMANLLGYSIYPSNGLLYLLSGGRTPGLTSDNTARMETDLRNSTEKTLRRYGCTHTTYDMYNQWVSQNLWRDMVAAQLGVTLAGGNPLQLSGRYWSLQKYFSTSMEGRFWDVLVYPGGSGGRGPSAYAERRKSGNRGLPPASGTEEGDTKEGYQPQAWFSSYAQSLGYYPRGATSLGLIDAVAGLALDAVGDSLYYRSSATPLKVPVFCAADWGNADPSKRVPTLYFSSPGSPPSKSNAGLLPSRVQPRRMEDLNSVSAGAHAISPDGDGINDSATITYELPLSATVSRSIWDGSRQVRSYAQKKQSAGSRSFDWDGFDDDGETVIDGVYTASLDSLATDTAYEVRPAQVPVYVNRTIPDLSRDWYLAEGYTGENETGGEFEEYVLVQNPNDQDAQITVTFMLPGGETRTESYVVEGDSRFTITVDSILPCAEVSTRVQADLPVAVERAMYFSGRKAGHASIGVSHPSTTWYLAEGYTAESFDEYVLIQNPGDRQAQVTATFMTGGAENVNRWYKVGPHSRFTIHVDDIVPADSVSTRIVSTEPVVVERAQYLNFMTAGTCSIGAASASRTWYLAEGYTDEGYETWVLIQNPQRTSNHITVTFMQETGENLVKNYTLEPESRFTIPVDELLPDSEVSVKVRSERPVLVERAMYWNDRSDGHACIGTPTPDSEWDLAEGYTDQGFETWILVQNPGDETRNVTFTFMEPKGPTTERSYQVQPRSRFTVGVDQILPASEVSTRVVADGPIIVERAMYFNDRSGGTDSIGIRGY